MHICCSAINTTRIENLGLFGACRENGNIIRWIATYRKNRQPGSDYHSIQPWSACTKYVVDTHAHRKHATITHVRTTDDTSIKSYHTRMAKLEIFVKDIKIVRPSHDVTENRFTLPWPARATKRTKLKNFQKAMREREPGKSKIKQRAIEAFLSATNRKIWREWIGKKFYFERKK